MYAGLSHAMYTGNPTYHEEAGSTFTSMLIRTGLSSYAGRGFHRLSRDDNMAESKSELSHPYAGTFREVCFPSLHIQTQGRGDGDDPHDELVHGYFLSVECDWLGS